jgi:sugar lactone lactonase YvrE
MARDASAPITRSTRCRYLTAALTLAALFMAGGAALAQDASCPDSGGLGYVCGVNNPEDLLRVEGTPFVLTGNYGTAAEHERGGFYSVDKRNREVRDLPLDFSGSPAEEYRSCPGPPNAELFSSHGIDMTGEGATAERTVYAVNHGGRESIEVFRLQADDEGLRLRWIGCALLPSGYEANSVAALPAGGFVTTVPTRSEMELLNAGLGQPTGVVLRWSRAEGWRPLEGVRLSLPNGILVSPDGAWLYVAAYTEQSVAKVSLATGATTKVKVPFNPDNLRWAPDGQIFATGQDVAPAVMQLTCVQSDTETCEIPTGVAMIDPTSLRATELFRHPGDEHFGAGTSSIVVGDELWIGSTRAQRLLRVPRRLLAAAVASERDAGAPDVRLTRRCLAAGALRVALTGEVARLREVRFKLGKRVVARDAAAPFRRTIPARTMRRTKARRLRAIAQVVAGSPSRVTVSRTLPRCTR